jgi:hypothetical protein
LNLCDFQRRSLKNTKIETEKNNSKATRPTTGNKQPVKNKKR